MVQWLKNLPSNAGDAGSSLVGGVNILHASGSLSLSLQAATREVSAHRNKEPVGLNEDPTSSGAETNQPHALQRSLFFPLDS